MKTKLTPEQAAAREARRNRFRALTDKINAMAPEERAAFAQSCPVILTSEGDDILVVEQFAQQSSSETPETAEAGALSNARLIAAAPELLEACRAVRALMTSVHDRLEEGPVIRRVLAAIARAEGGAE